MNIIRIIQILWNGILFVCTLCIVSLIGKVAIDFVKSKPNIADYLIFVPLGSILVGLLFLFGLIAFALINPNHKWTKDLEEIFK